VRSILYLAALQASRRCPRFADFRARLQAAGQPVKAAIVATVRKLLTCLNAMLAKNPTSNQPRRDYSCRTMPIHIPW
jgi:transposase